jgi:ribose 5-phosphate isomerase A
VPEPGEADPQTRAREAAAAAALERIEEGMSIGLGSGRALWKTMDLMAERWPDGPPVRAATASEVTAMRAKEMGIELVELTADVRLDLAVDGADEIDPELGLIKGGGAALLREKLVIGAADRFLVVAETEKKVDRLGERHALPVEVVKFAWEQTRVRVVKLVDDAPQRCDDDGKPIVTDEGHYLLDCGIPKTGDLYELARELKALVGVVEHGLFLGIASEALLGKPDGGVEDLKL